LLGRSFTGMRISVVVSCANISRNLKLLRKESRTRSENWTKFNTIATRKKANTGRINNDTSRQSMINRRELTS